MPTSAFAPASNPDDLAATISDLLSQGPADVLAFELALAGLMHAVRTNRPALHAALLPVIDKGLTPQPGSARLHDLPLATPLRQLHTLAVKAVWRQASYSHPGRPGDFQLVRLLRDLELPLDRQPGMDPYALRTPADILTLRLAELAARIGDPAPVELVSTPTDADGWIDAEVLLARIAEAESAGWQPWPLDFDQALLRLTEDPGPATVRAAHHLVSPAGRRLAGWLRGGRPSLPSSSELMPDPTSTANNQKRSPRIRPLITLPDPPLNHTPSTLIHLLRRGWYPPRPMADGSCWTVCWPALLPAHADLVAIAVAWHPRHPDTHGAPCPTPALTQLAQTAHAQARGSGTYAAIARALTSRSPAKRADAADAFAALAASGGFDADHFAAALAAFATRTDRQVLRSLVPPLQHILTTRTSTSADKNDKHTAANNAAAKNTATRKTATPTAVAPPTLAPADRSVATAIGTAILGWLPAILPPAVDQPLPYTSHLLNLAADALTSARTPTQPILKPSPTVSAAIDVLTPLASRASRSPVSDAANALLGALPTAW